MKLVGLIQWLSTAFVIFVVISWIAVGHPGTTTTLLWSVQDILAELAGSFADQDADFFPETNELRGMEDDLAESYEESAIFESRPLGEFARDDAR